MSDDNFEDLPPDLQDIADALVSERDVADGHLLERVMCRLVPAPAGRSVLSSAKTRFAAVGVLVACLGMNASGALASVLSTLGLGTSSSSSSTSLSQLLASSQNLISTGTYNQSGAKNTYCYEYGGSDHNKPGGTDHNKYGGSDDNKTCCSGGDDEHWYHWW